MESHHECFSLQSAGLQVSTKFPYLGALPDGIISCSCCGTGLLEIKCPYKYRNCDIKSISDSDFYLQLNQSGQWELDTQHDIFSWTSKSSITVRVVYDHFF